MTARVVLVSGKGGVGKTTVAASTAATAARAGVKSLVVSLDRAHNLGEVLGQPLGPEPSEVAGVPGLFAMEADPQAELGRQWRALSGYLSQLLHWAGLGGVEADEVAVFPGLEELLVLTRLTEVIESGDHELVVVDLAPTASSLRLLSFPELMAGPLGKIAGWERSFLRLFRPMVKRATAAPVPDDALYEVLADITARLTRLKALLTDPLRACVRLVSIPERVVIEETQQAFTLLSLYGLCVDAVILNRVLPTEAGGGYFEAWMRIQARELARARERFAQAPVLELPFAPAEVIGPEALLASGRVLYGERDASRPFVSHPPVRFTEGEDGTTLELRLPHADPKAISLSQREAELIVTAGGWRRQLALPRSLHGRAVRSARFKDGTLRVLFAPTQPARQEDLS